MTNFQSLQKHFKTTVYSYLNLTFRQLTCKHFYILIFLASAINMTNAMSFYVATGANPNGDGSFNNPWALQTALNHPSALKPGDTVWLKGGIYTNNLTKDPSYGYISYVCNTNGNQNAQIVFRNYDQQRVIIDGDSTQIVLYLGAANNFSNGCSYTTFWGIEFMSSTPLRNSSRSYILCVAPNIKFINLILHDLADGIDLWNAAKSAELYGCLIYHNGWEEAGTLAGHGHGIYTQNDTTNTRIIKNNIFFNSYGFNVKLWSTNQGIDNYNIENNIVFNGGTCARDTSSRLHNFYIVNNNINRPTKNLNMRHNYTYAGITKSVKGLCNNIGANYGSHNMILDSNYFLGQLRLTAPFYNFSGTGNVVYGGTKLSYISATGTIDWNLWKQTTSSQNVPTSGVEAFVLPNQYERNKAHIAVYNWAKNDTVKVDLSKAGFKSGDHYVLSQVLDLFSDTISGIVSKDGSINIAMTGHSTSKPIGGILNGVSQFPLFGAFVLQKTSPDNNNSLAQNIWNANVKIFPNPSSNWINVQIKNNDGAVLRIFNALGQEIDVIPMTLDDNQVDVSNLLEGIYFVAIESLNGKTMYQKLTILNK